LHGKGAETPDGGFLSCTLLQGHASSVARYGAKEREDFGFAAENMFRTTLLVVETKVSKPPTDKERVPRAWLRR
jgi:hypothetical protein